MHLIQSIRLGLIRCWPGIPACETDLTSPHPSNTDTTSQTAAATGFLLICRMLLAPPTAPQAWLHFAGCGACGMACSYVFIASTAYYTDYAFHPVRSIAEVKPNKEEGGVNQRTCL